MSATALLQTSVALTIKNGETLPIYLEPKFLSEAEHPSELTPDFIVNPGPERLYGWAIRDLRDYLSKMTKAKYPLTSFDEKATVGIFAGTLAQFPDFKSQQAEARKITSSSDPEAFVIEVQGDKLFILGKSETGFMAAIYTFLDKLGCKWYAPGKLWENIPEFKSLVLSKEFDVISTGPSYRSRSFLFDSANVRKAPGETRADWQRRNRLGGTGYITCTQNQEMIPESLFATRPELFGWNNGKQSPLILAQANPEVVNMTIESAIRYFKENKGKGSYFNSFSTEIKDGIFPDEKSLPKVGNHSHTDLTFWFANQVAAGIEKAGFKDQRIGMASYSTHSSIPSFDLHPQVGVMVHAVINFTDNMLPQPLTVEQRLDGFIQRKCKHLGVFELIYYVVSTLEKPVNLDPLALASRVRGYGKHGATHYLTETADSWIMAGSSHYLLTRILWDLETDPKKELEAYYQGAFGPAAREVRMLYEDWIKAPKITSEACARWHQRIVAADALVKGKSPYEARLNVVKRYYLYLKFLQELESTDPKFSSKEECLKKLLHYVASNRGHGAFDASFLLRCLIEGAQLNPGWAPLIAGTRFELNKMGPELITISKNYYDEQSWKAFPAISDERINEMFSGIK